MIRRGVAWSAVVILALAVSIAVAPRARADADSDDRIKQRIQTRLAGQVNLHIESLGLQVQDGNVILTGTVGSVGEKTRAERLVGGIVGVTAIANELTVKATDRSEQAIAQEVQRRLESRTRFRKTPIKVTVTGTEVTLEGAVERAVDRLDAEEIAAEAPGATRVVNNLQVASGGAVTPEWIRSRVMSILTNPLTFGVIRNLEVSVDQGAVTLRGAVSREADRIEAAKLALSVPGVTGVTNKITLTGS